MCLLGSTPTLSPSSNCRTFEMGGASQEAILSGQLDQVQAAIQDLFEKRTYPCVGAKAVFARGLLRVGIYDLFGTRASVEQCCDDLGKFVVDRQAASKEGKFSSFIAVFPQEVIRSERAFHYRLWYHLTMMRQQDKRSYRWSSDVEERTESPRFGFSANGAPFFIIGLYPSHPRLARRFPWAALVFNPHDQFKKLREQGVYDSMKMKIRSRDALFQTEQNTFLSDHGTESEAKQYSGIVAPVSLRIPAWD